MKKTNAKIMPHNLEAEQSVLGCMLIDNETPISIMSKLNDNDFYSESNKIIFGAMQSIYRSNRPIDFVTITDYLDKQGELETVGGIEYITFLTNVVPSAANYSHYVDIVKRESVLRNLISCGQKIIENAYECDDKEKAITEAEKLIFDISQKEDQTGLEHISKSLNEVFERFDLIAKDPGAIKGLGTGFIDLDKLTNGLQKSDLILLAARPGVGKTSFAMNIITHIATNLKKSCAVFPLEMPATQLSQRAVCSIANVSMERALKGKLTVEEWKSLLSANKKLTNANIYIDDSSVNTPINILSKCRRLKREKGLDVVMIDYLQLMSNGGKNSGDNRQQEISEMTRALKIASRELNVPVILLSQLSRAVETRKDHRPVLSDLRESGSIEQDADIVMFIYKADMYNDVVSEDEPGICEVMIAKHRNGPLGNFKLRWIGETTSFVNINDYKKPVVSRNVADLPANETLSSLSDINASEYDSLSDFDAPEYTDSLNGLDAEIEELKELFSE